MSDVYRKVCMSESGIQVEHNDYEAEWSSDVHVDADAEGTTITVGDLRLHVTGEAGGFHGCLTFDRGSVVLFDGDYRRVPASSTREAPDA